jgi:hypothetical protein
MVGVEEFLLVSFMRYFVASDRANLSFSCFIQVENVVLMRYSGVMTCIGLCTSLAWIDP